jgi:ATP phosphoribosyltransferase regulatory subunit
LALDALTDAGAAPLVIDLADARVLRGLLAGVPLDAQRLQEVAQALADKDAPAIAAMGAALPAETAAALKVLLRLYGGGEVLQAARDQLPARPLVRQALDELAWLATHLGTAHPQLRTGFDLSDMSGYAYYSGARFAIFGERAREALARGGRYDEVGAVFGRNRPAVGFSLDLKLLAEVVPRTPAAGAIRAPWGEDAELRAAVRRLREAGETVIAVLPGDEPETAAFVIDRELVPVAGRWVLRALDAPAAPLNS